LKPETRGPINKLSYDYLMIRCQSYDRLTTDVGFTEHLMKDARLFFGMIHLQNGKIILDSVRKLAYGILSRNLITL